MVATTQNNSISILEKRDTIIYNFDSYRYIKSTEEPVENRIQSKVKKTLVKKHKTGYIFSVEVSERKQSNKEDIYEIEDKLADLQKKLVLYTNKHGEIISIINRGEISEEWYIQKKILKKHFRDSYEDIDVIIDGIDAIIDNPEELLKLIKKSEVITLLFPPIYNYDLLQKNQIDQSHIIHDFFDTTALPFKIQTKIAAFNEITSGYQIIRSGDLDTGRFDNEQATDVISTLFNVHSYNIKIDSNCFEAYDLTENHTVDTATLLMNVEIPGIYSFRQISKLKQV